MMKSITAFNEMMSLTALLICAACVSASEQPDKAATKIDRHSEITASMVQKNTKSHFENHSMRWFDSRDTDETRGVALVLHGLNLRPSKMESIIKILTDTGIDVLNLSLRGHGENYDHHTHKDPARARLASFKAVSYELWIDEICAAYAVARNRSIKKDVPLFFIGFSLGGLLGADLLASRPDIQFDRMVLFAPAIKMHVRNNIIRVLSPFPRLAIPSYKLSSYQSNDRTPMAGYNALFDSLKNFAGHVGPGVNLPTLVFIDQKDEIVSYRRLKQMVQDKNLDQWQIYIVYKESSAKPAKIHHLIIDAPSTGENVWKDMMQAMIDHLYQQNYLKNSRKRSRARCRFGLKAERTR